MTSRARLGKRAEAAARDYLMAQGFEILLQNARVGPLEIDIVARKGALLAIVEVRTRGASAYERALASVTPAKQKRLASAAERLWRERYASDATLERVRFDVIAVTFAGDDAEVEHIPAAFVSSA